MIAFRARGLVGCLWSAVVCSVVLRTRRSYFTLVTMLVTHIQAYSLDLTSVVQQQQQV